MSARPFLHTGTLRKGEEWGRTEPEGLLPGGGEPEACLLPSPAQVLSDGEEGLPGPALPQLDARLLCLSLLLPALQEPGAHQLPRVSGVASPQPSAAGLPFLGTGKHLLCVRNFTCTP